MMSDLDRLPDEAWVVRCGLPPFTNRPLIEACRRHPQGPYGVSIQAAVGLTMEQLATACQNKWVGYTTVRAIREMGYDVVRTSGEYQHATVVVPEDWEIQAAIELTRQFQP